MVGSRFIKICPSGGPDRRVFPRGKFGLKLAFVNASSSAVWPCTGIALAAFLILGYRVWPAILTGAFLVNVTPQAPCSRRLIATGNTLEGAGCYLVCRFASASGLSGHRTF
jgi:hypothetical protein